MYLTLCIALDIRLTELKLGSPYTLNLPIMQIVNGTKQQQQDKNNRT